MGSCFSSSSSSSSTAVTAATDRQPPTAKVINANGSLVEYYQPIEVFHVLGLNQHTFFLCNADGLFYGHHIQALDANHFIEIGKLYFFLPAKRLNHPLTVAEMAALAVSANSAFADAALLRKKKRGIGRRKGVQVMPVITAIESDGYASFNERSFNGSWKTVKGGRALRRGERGVERPFRPRLSSIEEVCE